MPLTLNDRLVQSAVRLLIALLLAMTWGFAGLSKLLAGGVPGWFREQFQGTFLATVPGLPASFYSIALLEALAALLALGSLLRGEAVRPTRPTLLIASVLMSLLLFVQLSLGKQLVGDFAGLHDLYMYFAGTLVMLLAVAPHTLPQNGDRP